MFKNSIFPACYVNFSDVNSTREAGFWLAAEEYIAKQYPEGNFVFIWQVNPTCVIGRNQDAHAELDIEFCRQNNINVIRRKSGGGAIFADENNLMISLVTRSGSVEELFSQFACTIADGLNALGANATVSGRNDICLQDGRKISGAAFYHLHNRNIAHCTMLYDTNPYLMRGSLTPQRAKLQSKGVKSVESRIALLKDILPYSIDSLRSRLRNILANRAITIGNHEIMQISKLEQSYKILSDVHSSTITPEITLCDRIEGCGNISIRIYIDADKNINSVELTGDFFPQGDASPSKTFTKAFRGCHINLHDAEATKLQLIEKIKSHKPHTCIRNLTEENLLNIIKNYYHYGQTDLPA